MNRIDDVTCGRADHHYVRAARGPRNFVDFSAGKLQRYIRKYGEEFCLVILCTTESPRDAYVIPFPEIRHMLTKSSLANDYRPRAPRWIGKIWDAWWLRIGSGSERLDLRPFYTKWAE